MSVAQTCLPMGDLDLGYHMCGTFFGEGAFLVSSHDSESLASANAPVSTIYSSGAPLRRTAICCNVCDHDAYRVTCLW